MERKSAALCIGIDNVGGMVPLQAAAAGARKFAEWARQQGFHRVIELVDDQVTTKKVTLADIFSEVQHVVEARAYEQLFIYFAGHGILPAPQAEYWLLSDAGSNPSEAVNLSRSAETARNSGIQHVVFISDACRATGLQGALTQLVGNSIFPSNTQRGLGASTEVDTFFATRPGELAYEVKAGAAAAHYKGVFTDCLLEVVAAPEATLQELVNSVAVVTSRKLRGYLEPRVMAELAKVDPLLSQEPEIRVESALPKYFAANADQAHAWPPPSSPPVAGVKPGTPARELSSFDLSGLIGAQGAGFETNESPHLKRWQNKLLGSLHKLENNRQKDALDLGISYHDDYFQRNSVQLENARKLLSDGGAAYFQRRHNFQLPVTGFTIRGAALRKTVTPGWESVWLGNRLELVPSSAAAEQKPGALVLQFGRGNGTLLPIMPGWMGQIQVVKSRVVSVSYVPTVGSPLYEIYQYQAEEIERRKAALALRNRYGYFMMEKANAVRLAQELRELKVLDPVLGIYAAYAYAQVGEYGQVYDILRYMVESDPVVPFDVLMLAGRYTPAHGEQALALDRVPYSPVAPLLGQGWALLSKGDPLYNPLHDDLRPHLVPALWTTYTAAGVKLLTQYLNPLHPHETRSYPRPLPAGKRP